MYSKHNLTIYYNECRLFTRVDMVVVFLCYAAKANSEAIVIHLLQSQTLTHEDRDIPHNKH